MAEIKKKSTLDRSACIVDRTADTGMRIKDIALKTKDAMQKNESKEDRSPSAYASGRTTDAAKLAAGKAAQQFYQRGRESVKTTQENIEKVDDAVQHFKTQQAANAAKNQRVQRTAQAAKSIQNQQAQNTAQNTSQTMTQAVMQHSPRQAITHNATRQASASGRKAVASVGQSTVSMPQQTVNSRIRFSGSNRAGSNRIVNRARSLSVQGKVRTVGRPGNTRTAVIPTGQKLQTAGATIPSTGQAAIATQTAMQRTMVASQQTMQNVRHSVRNASDFVRAIARATASAFRITVGSTKALLTALLAGAWLSVMIIIVIAVFGGAMSMTGGTNGSVYTEVSAAVQA